MSLSSGCVDAVNDEAVDQARIMARDGAAVSLQAEFRHDLGSWTLHRLAGDDGDTAMIGAPLASSASRMPGTARIGSTLTKGSTGR
jgi:hypothetical protein